ncbi:uncharacterized protein LOC100568949 [Acyrthosiphon pisum]|uniref:Uncharacterized protein n=1 Tax=Acyrthosiphon pisum TaxID=7029 RepID=A0A8R2A495_ACYPI|nr:uncharacterized protein LOC100568949 [Acyrthosiphon pisum]|eukprot:XP_003241443.1 PREDICTED: uncharacterized protein LOC100568949 [Acyrthosiphon pisum]
MPTNFFKKDNTSEIIQANLLKYTFLAKRQELRKNVVPMKYRNNNKLATLQIENERDKLLTNLNIGSTESKKKQDIRNRKEINKLCTKKIQASEKLQQYNKYLAALNEEIRLSQKGKNKNSKIYKSKTYKKLKIHCDLNNLLFKHTHVYNSKVKEQNELRHTLDGLLRELGGKKEKYDSIMCQLNKAAKLLKRIGDNALKSNKDREQAHSNLVSFQETSMLEKKQRERRMYMSVYKLKSDLERSEFLQKKNSERLNRNIIHSSKDDLEQNKIQNDNEELITLMKHLVHISGDTDLKMILDNVLKINSNKESLFRHLMFLEQQCLELENSINRDQNIAIDWKILNNNRINHNECTLKHYFQIVQTNSRILNSTQELTDNMKAVYDDLCDKIYTHICRPLKIKINDPLNEENIMDYMTEIENKSYELLYKINCIETSCITGQTEDPMTSDGESKQNLIIKDYNGIEVKMHQILKMQDTYSIQDMHDNGLNNAQTLTMCQENQAGVVRIRSMLNE